MEGEDRLQFEAASLLIEIQDLKGISKDVVATVISKVNNIFESFLNVLMNRFKSKCGAHDALAIEEISDIINSFMEQNVFEGVQTRTKLDSYIDFHRVLVKPVKEVLLEKRVILGNITDLIPVDWGYYVPFLPSLERLLSCPEVLLCVDNPLPHKTGVFKTALDGGFYRSHELVKRDPLTLAVSIYADGAEVTDTASTKSGMHGLTFVYWTLMNIHPDKRSSLHAIFLLAVVKSSTLKKHGYTELLADFIKSVNQLSSTGVNLRVSAGVRNFKGLFLCSSGDNPGSANLGRFKESASFSKKPCRQCYVSQEELYVSFQESDFVLRSKNRHLAEVQEVEAFQATSDESRPNPSVQYGINGRSVLMSINGCDVTKCFPQDVMHDTLEGTLKLDMCCTLSHVLEKKSLSLNEINQKIAQYSKFFGVNKPAPIYAKHVVKFKLRLTAAEAVNLAYILPFVLRKKNHQTGKLESVADAKNLLLWILRLNLMDLLLSEEITMADVMHIRHLVEVHHKLFQELYPGREIPKMHYEVHYATHILLFGPPRQYWCMRFEAKHAFFKRRWRLSRNLKDHAGSLALAHQRAQAGRMLLSSHGAQGPFLSCADKFGTSSTKYLHSFSMKTRAALDELSPGETVQKYRVATVKGVTYRKGRPILVSFDLDHKPIFGKVMHLLQVKDNLVFVYQKFDNVKFVNNINSFQVRHTSHVGVIKANDLPYYHGLFLVPRERSCFIVVPCRSNLSVQDFHPAAMD